MMRSAWLLGLTVLLVMAIAAPGTSFAEDPPAITQVYVMDTNGQTDVFLNEAKNNEKIYARLGIKATRRYMRATLAGSGVGRILLAIDYPNLASMAEAQARLANDPEWQKYGEKLAAAGIAAESNSVWVDITP